MKNFIKSLKKLKRVSLTENEKMWGKEELIHFMEKHPVRNPESARHQLQKARTYRAGTGRQTAFAPLYLIQTRPMTALIVITLIFSLGGGTSMAANNALPGDALYHVKIHVNERVESTLAFSQEAEADFNLEKAETRLRETEELASKNTVKANVLIKTENRFDKHIEKAEKLAAKFEAKGNTAKAAEINARLEAMLEVHSQVLARLQKQLSDINVSSDTETEAEVETREGDEEEFGKFVTKIKIKSESLSDEDGEEESGEGPSMQAALNAQLLAERHMERVLSFAEKKYGKATTEMSAEAKASLDAAKSLMAEGNAQIEAENYAKAFATFQQAHKQIQKTNSYIATGGRVDIEFDFNGGSDKDEDDSDENNETEDEEENDNEDDDDNEDDEDDENEAELEADVQLNVFNSKIRTRTNMWSRF